VFGIDTQVKCVCQRYLGKIVHDLLKNGRALFFRPLEIDTYVSSCEIEISQLFIY